MLSDSDRPTPAESPAPVDVLHLMFGGLGGQLGVVRGISAGMVPTGLRSAAISYAPPGAHLRDVDLWQDFSEVVFVDKAARIDLQGSRRIGRVMRRLRPRALLLHTPYAPLQTLRVRLSGAVRAAVLVEHTTIPVRTFGEDLRSLLALPSARGVVFLTDEYAAAYPLRRVVRALGATTRVVANGVDTDLFSPDRKSERTVVGMAARLTPLKDVGTLIGAVAELRRRDQVVEVRIAGDGPSRPSLEQQARHLGVDDLVRFDGLIAEQDLARWLRGLTVYVHASQGETMSTSVLQAMATGLPCVLSRSPGLSRLGEGTHGDGVALVPVGDCRALADELEDLLADPDRCRTMGDTNRRRALRDHGLSTMAAGYLEMLATVDRDGPWGEALSVLRDGRGS